MKRLSLIALALATPLVVMAQTVVFDDTFANTSSLNPGTPQGPSPAYVFPTQAGNSSGYSTDSSKAAAGNSIAAGHLDFGLPSTTSAFVEVQSLFATTPVTISSVNDYVQLNVTFTTLAGNGVLGTGQTNETLNVGLYNSGGGTLPLAGLQSTGISSVAANQTGGTALWQGYNGKVQLSGAGNAGTGTIYTRPQQNNSTGANYNQGNQDLLFNGAGTGTYRNVAGVQVGSSTASTTVLSSSTTYTLSYTIMQTAAGVDTISYTLFSGAGTNGTSLFTMSQATTAALLATSFDGFSIGYRMSGLAAGITSGLDVNEVQILTDPTVVPEPASAVLFLGGMGALVLVRRMRR